MMGLQQSNPTANIPLTNSSNVILNNSIRMPLIGLGTYQVRGEAAYKVTKIALEVGYRHIDTARIYGNEEYIAKAITESKIPRNELFITSKVSPADLNDTNVARSGCIASCDMFGGYVDLYLIHWPGAQGEKAASPKNRIKRMQTWQLLESLYKEGKLRAIGVSNYTVPHLTDLLSYCTVIPMVNQIEMHPKLYPIDIIDFCNSNNIKAWAYSSLGTGNLIKNDIVVKIATKCQVSPALVLLRWAIQKGTGIIPKTTSESRMKENFTGVFLFSLSDTDMNELDSLNNLPERYCWNPTNVL